MGTHRQGRTRDLIDVLDPLVVAGNIVGRQSEQLDSPLLCKKVRKMVILAPRTFLDQGGKSGGSAHLLELFVTLSKPTELGSADG